MGAFRTPTARATDIARLVSAQLKPVPEGCAASQWLDPGEEIVYRTKLPYSAENAMVSGATTVVFDEKGRPTGRYDVGVASHIKVVRGIVSWTLFTEDGKPAPEWDPQNAPVLLDALEPALVSQLNNLIDAGSPPPLEVAVTEDGQPDPVGQSILDHAGDPDFVAADGRTADDAEFVLTEGKG